jgi:ribosome maturation factor RimP
MTIELDKVNGIDLDTIVEATNIINPIIDKLDLIDDQYILDIVSRERGDK